MPRILDNIDEYLTTALQNTIDVSYRGDFCVGYFNLRGWKQIADHIDRWPGGRERCCRLLVGMQRMPQDELRLMMPAVNSQDGLKIAGIIDGVLISPKSLRKLSKRVGRANSSYRPMKSISRWPIICLRKHGKG